MNAVFVLVVAIALLPAVSAAGEQPPEVTLQITHQHARPVLTKGSPGTQGNKYGFEGGRCIKIGQTHHLLVSEMTDDVRWAKTRLAHWTSPDLLTWQRISTLYESSGDYTGQDPRAALWLPQPAYDEAADRWNLFYAAFKCAPNGNGKWLLNHEGRIWRAVSKTPGQEGIGGPYEDTGIILEPGKDSDAWEGLQGTDSFHAFQAGGRWLAFYGSAHTQKWPCDFWGVGLASADTLAGPWKRLSSLNPVLIDKRWVENMVVTRLPGGDGAYVAVFDATPQGLAIGYTASRDGLHWSPAKYLKLDAGEGNWLKQPRTPLGLVPRADGDFDLLFTGTDKGGYGSMGYLVVRVNP